MADRQKGRYTNGSGRTCQNCARAKIRCIRSEATGSCDRWVNWRDRRCSMSDWLIDAAAWGNPVTFGRVEIRMETLEAKVDQLLAQSGVPIPVLYCFHVLY
ncbi:transcriptional regulator WAR1 [Penicillium hordei]|uniref:Transcriptional regulator WAR1 n=1 Tax=Penicillium hordei TaxID=40994 RepID=A0AAD6DYC8_9EURO|nr:transcriptional regulator WAR1 [Penicillium hordei]KAJ5597300.1 transcriptional regulator WAR1 [Penicillium hordei]